LEIYGKSGGNDVDRVVWMDDLSVGTLIKLVERLESTTEMEQFIFREAEMDDAYRQADMDWRHAVREQLAPDLTSNLERVRSLVFTAHDYVGLGRTEDAIRELNTVIGIKIGLEEQQ
jgi:L-ribulose-5-phosphate 3-epimerase UlaE